MSAKVLLARSELIETMPKTTKNRSIFPLIALVLAWLVPGAGHVYISRARRGVIIFITISATFWTGIAIGGVMTVDRENERWWFIADMCTGVHGIVAWQRSEKIYEKIDVDLAKDRRYANQRLSIMRKQSEPRRSASLRALRELYASQWLAEKGLALASPADAAAHVYAGVAGLLNLLCIFDAVILSLIGAFGEPTATEPADNKAAIGPLKEDQ